MAMARPYKISKIPSRFNDKYSGISSGKIDLSFTPEVKPKVFITLLANAKMHALVNGFSTEVAWHGVAYRDGDNDFKVMDIIVYPQKVTGGNVSTDQLEYDKWLANLTDEQFNNLRFQGHSHVNFPTSPSGTDIATREKTIGCFPDDYDGFYIFMIINKSGSMSVTLIDFKANMVYETEDIDVEYLLGDEVESDFISKSKDIANDKPLITVASKTDIATKQDDDEEEEEDEEIPASALLTEQEDYEFILNYCESHGYDMDEYLDYFGLDGIEAAEREEAAVKYGFK